MRSLSIVSSCGKLLLFFGLLVATNLLAQSNVTIRVMAANITSGNNQLYETAGINIFQGLKPDVVAIQEFRYNSSHASNDLRTLVNTAFGPDFNFYCEQSGNIPNGIVSRWPILSAGALNDPNPTVSDRDIAWAQIDVPGTNDLYVISVHLYGSGTPSDRNDEAMVITNFISTNGLAGKWVVVGGDFNTGSRGEACVTTFKSFLTDNPIPYDGSSSVNATNTNEPRSKPYDYVMPSFSLANLQVPVVLGANTFTNGLVFDSTVYNNNFTLSAVSPVTSGDSHVTGMQHMAVIKDFLIPVSGSATNPPVITAQPQGKTNAVGSVISLSVTATGSGTLAYQWLFNGVNMTGATTNPLNLVNVQLTNSGNYSVFITNSFGSVTSSAVALLATNAPPTITVPPQSVTVNLGDNATFGVTASGTPPLYYQWQFGGTNISGAMTNPLVIPNVQLANAGNYSVVISNFVGSVTSSVATLSVFSTQSVVIAQWNFNSPVADGSATTGTRAAASGSGTNSFVGGATANSGGEFASGSGSGDTNATDNSAWNTATYPAASANNKTAGVQFNVSTAGRQNIVITWASQASTSGSKYGRLQYSTNGTVFTDFPTCVTNPIAFSTKTNSLIGFAGVNNNTNFAFRLVTEFESTATGGGAGSYVASGTYQTTGTIRFDMVTVSGTPATQPAAAVLTAPVISGNQFSFNITGSVGASYIVQTSTNLGSSNWLPVFTNVSPFSFSDTNPTGLQKFYRVVAP